MIPATLAVWSPYTGSAKLLLFLLLLVIGAGIIWAGTKVKKPITLPRMGTIVLVVVMVIWAFSILTFLRIVRAVARYTGSAASLGPIFPITIFSAICAFAFVAYVSRKGGVLSSLGNGFLAFIAGPMVFEFPFILIVIPQVHAPLGAALIFFIPLFIIIFTTISMLLYSRRTAITKYSLYFYGAMIVVFAIWALDGYSYPTNPVSFVLNAISKVFGFVAVAAMFVPVSLETISDVTTPTRRK